MLLFCLGYTLLLFLFMSVTPYTIAVGGFSLRLYTCSSFLAYDLIPSHCIIQHVYTVEILILGCRVNDYVFGLCEAVTANAMTGSLD